MPPVLFEASDGFRGSKSEVIKHEESVIPRIVAFVNPLSGGQRGADAIGKLKAAMRDYDTVEEIVPKSGGPRPGLQRIVDSILQQREEEPRQVICLACGGDGTFNWISSTFLAMVREADEGAPGSADVLLTTVDMVPMPLGTGNDLARSLGWGSSYPGSSKNMRAFVSDARLLASTTTANIHRPRAHLDLWDISFSKRRREGAAEEIINTGDDGEPSADVPAQQEQQQQQQQPKFPQMQNYFSIGVDVSSVKRNCAIRPSASLHLRLLFDVSRLRRPCGSAPGGRRGPAGTMRSGRTRRRTARSAQGSASVVPHRWSRGLPASPWTGARFLSRQGPSRSSASTFRALRRGLILGAGRRRRHCLGKEPQPPLSPHASTTDCWRSCAFQLSVPLAS